MVKVLELYIFGLFLCCCVFQCECFVSSCVVCEYMGGTSTDKSMNKGLKHISHESTQCLKPEVVRSEFQCTGGQTGCGVIYMQRNISYTVDDVKTDVIIQDVKRTCQFILGNETHVYPRKCWSIQEYDKLLQSLMKNDFTITSVFDSFHDILDKIGAETTYFSEKVTGKVCQCNTENCNTRAFHQAHDLYESLVMENPKYIVSKLPSHNTGNEPKTQKSVTGSGMFINAGSNYCLLLVLLALYVF